MSVDMGCGPPTPKAPPSSKGECDRSPQEAACVSLVFSSVRLETPEILEALQALLANGPLSLFLVGLRTCPRLAPLRDGSPLSSHYDRLIPTFYSSYSRALTCGTPAAAKTSAAGTEQGLEGGPATASTPLATSSRATRVQRGPINSSFVADASP